MGRVLAWLAMPFVVGAYLGAWAAYALQWWYA